MERGGEDQRRRPRLPPPRPVGRDPAGRLPRVGARACSSSTTSSPTSSRSTCSTRPRSSPRRTCRSGAIGRLVLDRVVDNFFAETEQVAFCTQNIVAGHRLHQRPAAAGPQLLVPRHAAEAARQPELHRTCRSTRRSARSRTSSRTGTWRSSTRSAASTTSRTRGRRRAAARARIPSDGFTVVPGRRGRREAAGARRDVRRPLQPGPAVLRQPDAGRAEAHRRRVRVRAEQGRAARHPRAHGRQPAQRRRGPRRGTSPTASGSTSCPTASTPAREPDHRPRAVAGAEHPRQRPGDASPAARSACSSPTAPTPRCSPRCTAAAEAEGAIVELIAPKVGGVDDQRRRRCIAADQKIDGGPSVLYDAVAVLAVGRAASTRWPTTPAAKDFVADAYAHCKFIGYVAARAAAARGGRRRGPHRRRLRRPRRARRRRHVCRRCGQLRIWDREALVHQV